jgi:hypothetical protein
MRSFVTRWICTVSRKGSVFGDADIFVGGNGRGFGFGAGVGEQPAGKSAGESARNRSASRSGSWNGTAGQVTRRARCRVFEIGLRLVSFWLGNRRRRRSCGLSTIFGEGFTWEKNGFVRDSAGCGGTGCFGRPMIKAALRGTTRFKTTRLAAAILLAALIAAAVFVAAWLVAARFAALRRGVLRRWEIASAYVRTLRASAAMASATSAPASTSAPVTAAITTPVSAAIGATTITLAGALASTASARRVVLSGIIVGRKVLRCRGVRIGLTLLRVVVRIVVDFGGVRVSDFAFRGMLLHDARLLVVRKRFMV